MRSLDTNILVYAANEDCPEHRRAYRIVENALAQPRDWIVAEQVLFEFYKALRNPKILTQPLSAPEAAERIRFLRERSGFMVCAYELRFWEEAIAGLEAQSFPYQRTHDLILVVTLRQNGVRRFYTRNVKDFEGAGFEELVDPIGAMEA